MVREPVKCESSCKLARLATTVVPTLHAFSRLRSVLGGKTLRLRANGDGRIAIVDVRFVVAPGTRAGAPAPH